MLRLMAAIALVAMLSACAQQNAPTRQELVVRGEYLVNGVAGCNDCHTPMTPQGPDMSQALQGATLPFGPLIDVPWAPIAPPIAGIRSFHRRAVRHVSANRRAPRWLASACADAAISAQ